MVFIKGLLIGIFMCAPVGPVGLLSVKRTLTQGRAAGIASVLGAATADLLYCCLAGFGITLISNFLEEKHVWLELAGGLILVLLGINIFFSKPAAQTANNGATNLFSDFTSTFLLMLANPFPLVLFTATFYCSWSSGLERGFCFHRNIGGRCFCGFRFVVTHLGRRGNSISTAA